MSRTGFVGTRCPMPWCGRLSLKYSWYWRRREPRWRKPPSGSPRADALGRAVERRTELVVAIPQQDGWSVPRAGYFAHPGGNMAGVGGRERLHRLPSSCSKWEMHREACGHGSLGKQ